jgi:hypothetical protein
MVHGLTLQPYVQGRYVAGATDGYRWRVEVIEARGLSPAIFLYKKVATSLYDPGTGGAAPPVEIEWAGEFTGVASPADLEEYPEGEPRVGDFPPFYRLDWVDQVFRGRIVAQAAYGALLGAVDALIAALDAQDALAALAQVVAGPPPPATPGQVAHTTDTLISG